ncbi:MAG: hypothetical protein CM1200mP28_03220 [Deltaproteobacteria bacterium]|nr:MAG: hypothetical protein CM1200mP28_03220 [Deltaproteobacteria bacterium]
MYNIAIHRKEDSELTDHQPDPQHIKNYSRCNQKLKVSETSSRMPPKVMFIFWGLLMEEEL